MAAASAALGRPFMPHQAELVDVFLEVQSEEAGDELPGEWAYDDGTATWQRRAGKTSTIAPLVTHRARMIDGARMFMTAHSRDKAVARWRDVVKDLESSALRGTFKRKIGNMHEEVRWTENDSLLVPFAPNEDGLHSETPDLVLIDELWAFDREQRTVIQAGYVPAFGTSGGQALKTSTQGTERSHWLNDETRAGRKAVEAGVRLGKMYHEHSIPDLIAVGGRNLRIRQLTDEQLVEACIAYHPAICRVDGCPGPRRLPGMKRVAPCPHGFTVRPAALRSAWVDLSERTDGVDPRGEFLRAYGNRSAEDMSRKWQAIDQETWTKANDPASIPRSARVSFGVWVDEDGEDASVSAAWRSPGGVMLAEHLHLQPGIRGLVDYVTQRAERNDPATVAIRNTKAARDVADELAAAGVPVLTVSEADTSAACSRHKTELAAGTWKHATSLEATAAAEAAAWVRGKWDRPGESISALGSQTLAGWGVDHAPPAPVIRKLVIR